MELGFDRFPALLLLGPGNRSLPLTQVPSDRLDDLATLSACRDIDRTVACRLTQGGSCIEHGRFSKSEAKRSGEFDYGRNSLVSVASKMIGAFSDGASIQASW